jgi:chaperonin cofactor prefoldin
MALKQYEEEYVSTLEAEVHSLQKERHNLEAKIQDLLAEIEQARTLKNPPAAP